MSYILDALRRADAEREREAGAVPTLHAQARPMPGRDDEEVASRGLLRWALPAVAVALVIAVGAFLALRGGTPDPAPVVARVEPVAARPPQSVMPPPTPVVVPAPVQSPVARPMPAPRAAAVPSVAVATPGTPAPAASAAAPAAVNARSATATPPVKVLRQAELPDALRREIPPMAIGGSIYSADRAGRMVIINGQVRREGDAVAPGLVVEQIGTKTAIFGFKGQRFEVPL